MGPLRLPTPNFPLDNSMVTKTKPKSAEPKNVPDPTKSVQDVLEALGDEQARADTKALVALMKRVSGKAPKIWNVATIGFDSYHYKYDSGREGDCAILSFYPRKGKFTIYLMDGCGRHSTLLEKLGKHTTTRVCLSFKRLGDLELPILEKILKESYRYIKAQGGGMGQVQEGWR
jgi:hypothetical protein